METLQNRPIDMHKAAALIILDKRLLVSRSKGSELFVAPGGKLEPGETAVQALIRELFEEQTISTTKHDLRLLGTYYAEAAGHDNVWLRMDVFFVDNYQGTLQPAAEIAENRWIDSSDTMTPQGSIFQHHVIPRLKQDGLIT